MFKSPRRTRRGARTVEPERGADAAMIASCSASGARARSAQSFGISELSRVREARRAGLRKLRMPRLCDAAISCIAGPRRALAPRIMHAVREDVSAVLDLRVVARGHGVQIECRRPAFVVTPRARQVRPTLFIVFGRPASRHAVQALNTCPITPDRWTAAIRAETAQ